MFDWLGDEAGPATSPVNPGLVPREVVPGPVVLVDAGVLDGLEDATRAGTATRPNPTTIASKSGRTVLLGLDEPFNWLTPQASVLSIAGYI